MTAVSSLANAIEITPDIETRSEHETIRVLHVDDDPAIQCTTKMLLQDINSNLEIDNASNVNEAFQKLSTNSYDAIISDYEMPFKNGLDFLKELKEKNNDTPFILFTGKGREEVAVKALNMGADGYYNKQGDPETVYTELSYGITCSVKRKRTEKQLQENQHLTQKILSSTTDMVYIYDIEENRNVYANRTVTDFLGYSIEQVQAMDTSLFSQILHPEDAKALENHHARFRDAPENAVYEIDYRMKHSNGEWRWLHSHDIIFLRTPEGKCKQILGTCEDITERKKSDEELKISQRHLEAAQTIAHVGSWEWDLAKAEPKWSPEMYRIYGVDPLTFAITFDNCLKITVPEDREMVKKLQRQVCVEGIPASFDHRIVLSSGEIRWVHVETKKVDDGTKVFGTVQDITEHKTAQELVSRNTEKINAIINSTTDLIYALGPDWKFVFANHQTAQIAGLTPAQLIGKNGWEIFPQVVGTNLEKALRECMNDRKPNRIIYTNAYGKIWENNIFPIEEGITVFVRDLTNLKLAETQVRDSQTQLNVFLEKCIVPAFIVNKEGKYIYVNQPASKLLGYTAEELLKLGITDLLFKEDLQEKKQNFAKLSVEGSFREELRLRCKDGNPVLVDINAVKLPNQTLLAFCDDITERKRFEKELQAKYESLEKVAESIDAGLVILGKDYRVIWSNSKLRARGFLPNQKCFSATSINRKDVCPDCGVKKVLEQNLPLEVHDYKHVYSSGKVSWSQLRSTPLRDKDGNISAVLELEIPITERKKTEETLKETSLIVSSIINSTDDVIYALDKEFKFLHANKALGRIVDSSPDQMIGKSLWSFFPKCANTELEKNLCEALERNERRTFVWQGVYNKRYQEFTICPFENGLAVFARDITEKMNIEKSLQESKLILENSSDSIIVTDLTGKITSWNKGAENIFGYTSTEMIGQPITKVVKPQERQEVAPEQLEDVRKGRTFTQAREGIRKDESAVWLMLTTKILNNEKNQPIAMVGFGKDITAYKKIEDKLRVSASLIDLTCDSIHVVDNKGKFVYFNKSTYEHRGYSAQEMGKMNLRMLDAPESAELIEARMAELFGKGSAIFESVQLCKDGARVPVEVHARVIGTGDHRLILSVDRDIGERKDAEKRIKQNQEQLVSLNEKLRVVGSLTRHDVANKLMVAKSNIYLLRKKLKDEHELLKYIDAVDEAFDHSDKMFEFSKLYERIGAEKPIMTNVADMFDKATALISQPSITVINKTQGLSVLADSMLQQLFYNLIDNSLRHGKTVSRIQLSFGKDEKEIKMIYQDNGMGVPRENKVKIFAEGFSTGGSGLGLKLVKRMVEVYGWTIVETGKMGKGARFEITIPNTSVSLGNKRKHKGGST